MIRYAVSARMEPALAAAARRAAEKEWTTSGQEADGTRKQWADLDHVPAPAAETKDARPRRYIGLRFIKPQGELFDDGHDRKHFAVTTNRLEDGAKVIEWHREKAGTAGHVHDEMKNELAAGRLPGRKSGANAAWFALDAIACNVPGTGGTHAAGAQRALPMVAGGRASVAARPQDRAALRRPQGQGADRARAEPPRALPLPGAADGMNSPRRPTPPTLR